MDESNDGFKIAESDLSRKKILSMQEYSISVTTSIKEADILILPGHDCLIPDGTFRGGTVQLYKLWRQKLPDRKICICAEDEKIKIEDLRSIDIWVPIFLVGYELIQSYGADVIAEMILDSVKKLVGSREKESKVDLKIFVEKSKGKTTTQIQYAGPLKGMKKLPKILREASSSENEGGQDE